MDNTEARKEIVEVARSMLAGKTHLLVGCRLIRRLRFNTDEADAEIFVPFRAIDSEIDHYPIGVNRDLCDAEYLKKIDQEIEEYLADTHEFIEEMCKKIIDRYSMG